MISQGFLGNLVCITGRYQSSVQVYERLLAHSTCSVVAERWAFLGSKMLGCNGLPSQCGVHAKLARAAQVLSVDEIGWPKNRPTL